MAFSQKEKRQHYNDVALGKKPVKDPSKFPPQRQTDYARGQADARNESAAIWKAKNSTPEEREAFKERSAAARAQRLTGKCGVCGKPCDPKYKTCYACFRSGKVNSAQPAKSTSAKSEKSTKAANPAKTTSASASLKNSAAPKDNFYVKYLQVKAKNKGAILFFRLGDFYEVLGEDAKVVSRVLDIVLTTRSIGSERIPMCGVPFHSLDAYIAKLVQGGYKVAIAENA